MGDLILGCLWKSLFAYSKMEKKKITEKLVAAQLDPLDSKTRHR